MIAGLRLLQWQLLAGHPGTLRLSLRCVCTKGATTCAWHCGDSCLLCPAVRLLGCYAMERSHSVARRAADAGRYGDTATRS
jgi:hypothetical protein